MPMLEPCSLARRCHGAGHGGGRAWPGWTRVAHVRRIGVAAAGPARCGRRGASRAVGALRARPVRTPPIARRRGGVDAAATGAARAVGAPFRTAAMGGGPAAEARPSGRTAAAGKAGFGGG